MPPTQPSGRRPGLLSFGCFCLVACLFAGFPSASAESTMQAVLQLQLMGPALRASQGRQGRGLLLLGKHSPQLPRTRRCPKRARLSSGDR